MTKSLLRCFALLCGVASCCAHAAEPPAIQVLGSWEKEGLGTDTGTAVIRFGIQDVFMEGGLASEMTIDLESVCKYSGEKPLVHENAGKTIAGFTASNVRVNYKINLIWIGHDNEILVDQNLNLRIADMLKKLRFKMPFDPTGFFLDKIIDHTLYIGYDTDSTKGEFKFQVDVAQDGGMRINPESIKMN